MRVARPRPGWLGEIADQLEQTHKELDAKRELIEVQPTLDAKQPYSRAANLNGCVICTASRGAQRNESR
jgi:hypothetical protein